MTTDGAAVGLILSAPLFLGLTSDLPSVTLSDAVMEKTFSTNATEDDVRYCYRLFLRRLPDEEGWKTFASAIRAGVSLEWLVNAFVDCVEFKNRMAEAEQRDVPQLVELADFRIYVLPDDLAVGRPILAQRIYKPQVTAAFRRLVKPGMVVVDVGANIGYFSLLCAAAGRTDREGDSR